MNNLKQKIDSFIESSRYGSIDTYRERLLDIALGIYFFAICFLVPLSLTRIFITGWLPLYSIHIGILVTLAALFFLRARTSYSIKVGSIVCIFYLISLLSFVYYGKHTGNPLYFGLCLLIAAIFLSFKQSLYIFITIALTLVYLNFSGLFDETRDAILFMSTYCITVFWLIKFIAFSVIFVTSLMGAGWINQLLKLTVDNLNTQKIELEKAQQQLITLSLTDPLTGLSNRRALREFTDKEFEHYKASDEVFSVMVVDLDHFKKINDTYGHDAGDAVLKNVASILKKEIREREFIARIGGEEFIVFLPRTHLAEAEVVAERIRESIERAQINSNGSDIPISASIGISEVQEYDENMKKVFYRADKALYLAKDKGRNQVVIL